MLSACLLLYWVLYESVELSLSAILWIQDLAAIDPLASFFPLDGGDDVLQQTPNPPPPTPCRPG